MWKASQTLLTAFVKKHSASRVGSLLWELGSSAGAIKQIP